MNIDRRTSTLLGLGEYTRPTDDEMYSSNTSSGGSTGTKPSIWDKFLEIAQTGSEVYKNIRNPYPPGEGPPPTREGLSMTTKLVLGGLGLAAVGTAGYFIFRPKKNKK